MKDLLEAWNGLKDKEEVMNAIKRLVDPMMVGAFLTVPPGIWEFTFISSTGEALTIKDTEPVIIQPTRYASSGGEKEIDLGAVNVEIEKVIEKISKKGTTVILATHNLFQSRRLSERVAHIFSGRIVEVSKTEEFFENPKTEISRKFIDGELQY